MGHFGIIGNPLIHSFSAKYFNEKFSREHIDAEYSLYPLSELTSERVNELLDTLDGFNVTFPYKEAIIPFLDALDPTAQEIGAVNVVHKRVGYNTDCTGFIASIRPLLRPFDRQALVLGTGGASKAVCHGLRLLGIHPTLVSRTPQVGQMSYGELNDDVLVAHTVIINCTPLGMYPEIDTCPPIPFEHVTARHLLFDCVYNPEETLFLQRGKAQGATIQNGKEMLIGQAQEAWKIWSKEHLKFEI
ncbi:MAG: shikimate dehydrogenase [Paludibacteraceae bacterium]|nr:shikimate dehydrogenase [Paludibacteraceae bacterium]